jgi:hypothetical protein
MKQKWLISVQEDTYMPGEYIWRFVLELTEEERELYQKRLENVGVGYSSINLDAFSDPVFTLDEYLENLEKEIK